MTRILADLPDEDIKWLDQIAAEQGKSRASVLREAVSSYRAETASSGNKDWLDIGFGAWKGTRNTKDFPARMPGIRVPYTVSSRKNTAMCGIIGIVGKEEVSRPAGRWPAAHGISRL
jgi:hypothetical protein